MSWRMGAFEALGENSFLSILVIRWGSFNLVTCAYFHD